MSYLSKIHQNNNEKGKEHITRTKIRLKVENTGIIIHTLPWEGILPRLFYLISVSPPTQWPYSKGLH
jgi:hypothetical protein